ncbi:hypothetical protein [Natronosalvus caseinilyticus]|uniref:hypothetical protein n=1 Tax=Natronosalvus caseinilyticus TaxID=2953747 RepID=UPI0028AAC341|nr:hypothetical protein [Natronosalvus caseinilyticus]
MEADYDPDSNYHSGSIPVQEAKAELGVFKRTVDVPTRYRLDNFASGLDPDTVWDAFVESRDKNWSEHTLKYRYESPWNKWCAFARERGVNSVTPTAEDLEDWFSVTIEDSKSVQTAHDIHFRVLIAVFSWVTEHTDYPHRYNPVLQAVLLEGATEELWAERVFRRDKYWTEDAE